MAYTIFKNVTSVNDEQIIHFRRSQNKVIEVKNPFYLLITLT